MDVLQPSTPEGRDRVARLLAPTIAGIKADGVAAKDLYVVLASTVQVLADEIRRLEGLDAVDDLDRTARAHARVARSGA